MSETPAVQPALSAHGAFRLPAVEVENYNVELSDDEGFIGDRASKGAFRRFIEDWRKPLREVGQDPFGEERSEALAKNTLIRCWSAATARPQGLSRGRSKALHKSSRWSSGAF